MYLLSVFASKKVSASYTHTHIHRDILTIHLKMTEVWSKRRVLSKVLRNRNSSVLYLWNNQASAHLQLLIRNFEGKIVQIKCVIFLPAPIFHLPAISYVAHNGLAHNIHQISTKITLSYSRTLLVFLCKHSYG